MTTISPKRKRNAARGQFLLLLLLLALVFCFVFLLRGSLASALWRVGEPLVKANSASIERVQVFFSGFASNRALVRENEQLRLLVAANETVLQDRDILAAENRELKGRLGRVPPTVSAVLAVVLSRPPGTPYDTLVLDVGSSDGIAVGDLVSPGGSVYIGRVSEVYASSARVILFSAPGESYNATLLFASSSTLAIALKGQGGGSFTAEVPSGILVRAGDAVVFNALGIEHIAEVVHVAEDASSSFITLYLQLPVNIYTLRFVEVRRTSLPPYAQ